jgi:hypothetical protein
LTIYWRFFLVCPFQGNLEPHLFLQLCNSLSDGVKKHANSGIIGKTNLYAFSSHWLMKLWHETPLQSVWLGLEMVPCTQP